MDKQEFKFLNRFLLAIYMGCKSCVFCKNENLSYIVGNTPNKNKKFCKLPFDEKIDNLLELRQDCNFYQVSEIVERDSTYPGATYAPHDNNHPDLLPDSSDIDFNPHAAKRCLNQRSKIRYAPKINNWDSCLKLLFDRKRCEWESKPTFEQQFPSPSEVIRLLNTSQIPTFTFRLGLPPQRGMGFDRGLWFYRSEKFNSTLDKNANVKSEMKKIMMVYLYHVWFKKLDDKKKLSYFLSLDSGDKFSLAKDLSWWMLNVFKDANALEAYPPEDEFEIEFIPMSLLDKAQEAKMLAEADCNSNLELDIEAKEYDELIQRYGYVQTFDGVIDTDGKEIY